MNANKPHRLSAFRLAQGLCLVLASAGTLLWEGCGTAHYRSSADKETYGVVQEVEGQVLGHTNDFTIDTPYSGRKPADIPTVELIEDRLQTNQRVLTINDALDLAVHRSRRYQDAKESLYQSALSLTGKRHALSPQFYSTSIGTVTRTSSGDVAHQN